MAMIADGRMAPIIDKELPIEESVAGIKLLEDREVFGKVVISP